MGTSIQHYSKGLLAGLALASALTMVGCSDGGNKKTPTSSSSSSSSTSSGTATSTKPEAFSFAAKTDVPVATAVSSESATITGITAAAPVSITGGSYSIDGGAFTAEGGSITEGQTVAVQVQSPDAFSSSSTATLDVGGVTADFTVTTEAQDTSPEAFTFTDQTGVGYSAVITSMPVTITGINDAVPVTVAGGEYQIGASAFPSDAGTVTNNQTITVRVTSSAKAEQTTSATLTVGDQTAAFSVTTKPDTVNPEVAIQFPPPASMTEGATIYIRGESSDLHSSVASLTVNGEPVVTEDGYATWSVELPLAEGENTLTVMAMDAAGNASAAEAVNVRRAPITNAFPNDDMILVKPYQVEIDRSSEVAQLLVSDASLPGIVAVDLLTGGRSVFLSNKTQEQAPFDYPIWMHVGGNGRLYVTETFLPAILEVDIFSGEITVFEDVATSQYISFPTQIALDLDVKSGRNRLIVADNDIIYWTDIESGMQGHFVDPTDGAKFASGITGTALDQAASLLFAVDLNGRIYKMDLLTGARTTLAEEGLSSASAIALDRQYDRLLLVDDKTNNVISADIASGASYILSSSSTPNSSNSLVGAWGLTVGEGFGYAFVVDQQLKAVLAVDLVSGNRVIISKSGS